MDDTPLSSQQNDDLWNLHIARFEYAWKYFDFHATQRTTMFNFFIIFSGIFISVCAKLLETKHYIFLLIASVIGLGITVMFIFLERRNEELVHISEEILRTIEKEVLFQNVYREVKWPKRRKLWGGMFEKDTLVPLGIFIRQDYDKENCGESKNLHGIWLPWIELLIGCMYLVFIFYLVYRFIIF
jgi:hypothetical protein